MQIIKIGTFDTPFKPVSYKKQKHRKGHNYKNIKNTLRYVKLKTSFAKQLLYCALTTCGLVNTYEMVALQDTRNTLHLQQEMPLSLGKLKVTFISSQRAF